MHLPFPSTKCVPISIAHDTPDVFFLDGRQLQLYGMSFGVVLIYVVNTNADIRDVRPSILEGNGWTN